MLIGILAGAFAITAWAASDASRRMAGDLIEALKRAGVPHKRAALAMGLEGPQLSRQLAASEPLNHYRLADLFECEPRVEPAYLEVRAERRGFYVVDRPELAQLAKTAALLDRVIRRKARTAKADLPSSRLKVSA